MERERVDSSNLFAVGYDDESRMLEVEFHTHTVYRYYNVPKIVVRQLLNAESIGEFFNFYVKDAYRWLKVR